MGTVEQQRDAVEMKGGNFMRVRVAVDVTKPLCRGRMITWDHGREGWVSFMYERLPNICYWCGHLSHDDKECVVWLSSKGALSREEQQYGPWLRAPQFNPARKMIVEVQGFDSLCSHRNPPRGTEVVTRVVSGSAGVVNSSVTEDLIINPGKPMIMEVASDGGDQMEDGHVQETDTAGPQNKILDFEAMIRDIDEAINTELVFSNSKVCNSEASAAMNGKDLHFGNNGSITKDLGVSIRSLKKEDDSLTSQSSRMLPTNVKFEMGQVNKSMERKANKGGPKSRAGKGKINIKHQHGPAIGIGETKGEAEESPKRGSWTRLHKDSKTQDRVEIIEMEGGPKRKCDVFSSENTCMGKKLRLDEETRNLSILMATHLGSAEAAEQLRWDQ